MIETPDEVRAVIDANMREGRWFEVCVREDASVEIAVVWTGGGEKILHLPGRLGATIDTEEEACQYAIDLTLAADARFQCEDDPDDLRAWIFDLEL